MITYKNVSLYKAYGNQQRMRKCIKLKKIIDSKMQVKQQMVKLYNR